MKVKVERRGRPRKQAETSTFNPSAIKTYRGSELYFSESLFKPLKTNREIDVILSTDGGLMPGTNLMIAGGPGSGKSTVVLSMLADFTRQGYKCLFVSGEMDEIAYYKYVKRLPNTSCVQTLFLRNYANDVKPVLEHVFNEGYDVIATDSVAEVIDMYRDAYRTTENVAESWFLNLQDKMKKGENKNKYYTSFINIQQVTKSLDFKGSNRLKHMMDAYCIINRSKDGLERSIHFEKNRDCDKDFKMYFSIYKDSVQYAFEQADENE